jgi:hypothetical protein
MQELPPVLSCIPVLLVLHVWLVLGTGMEKLHEAELLIHHKHSCIACLTRDFASDEIDPNGSCAAGAFAQSHAFIILLNHHFSKRR